MTKVIRSGCIAITSRIVRQMDCGSISSWVQVRQMLGTGPLVGTLRFDVHSGWANVEQEMRGQQQECCGSSEHSGGPSFLKHSRVRSKTSETGWQRYTARCILIWCGLPFFNSRRFADDSSLPDICTTAT